MDWLGCEMISSTHRFKNFIYSMYFFFFWQIFFSLESSNAIMHTATAPDENEISFIPSEIGLLTSLEKLDMREFVMTRWFLISLYWVCDWIQLIILKIVLNIFLPDGNKIKLIPSEIGLMSKLKRIDFSKYFKFFDCARHYSSSMLHTNWSHKPI